jgi:cytochrome c
MRGVQVFLFASAAALLAACEVRLESSATAVAGGSEERGRRSIERLGCASCHTIPGIRGANALVGPPLDRIGSRSYVAGVLVNRPENLVAWLRDPPGVDPLTAMPKLGVTEQEARDIASYLYTLR